jgi:hypothetical protein
MRGITFRKMKNIETGYQIVIRAISKTKMIIIKIKKEACLKIRIFIHSVEL